MSSMPISRVRLVGSQTMSPRLKRLSSPKLILSPGDSVSGR